MFTDNVVHGFKLPTPNFRQERLIILSWFRIV